MIKWTAHQLRGIKHNLLNQRFGLVTVIAEHETHLPGSWWVCRCDCGKPCVKSGSDLKRKAWTHSCGCMPALVKSIQLQNQGGIDRRLNHLHKLHRS